MSVVWKLNMPKYSEKLSEAVVAGVAKQAENEAKGRVRTDTGFLKTSIVAQKVNKQNWIVGAGWIGWVEYALAQEYGRPDLDGYGFTPYMRPGARAAMRKLPIIVKKAELEARAESRV